MPAKKHKLKEIIGKLREIEIVLGHGGQVLIEAWRRHYNTIRPHGSLAYYPLAPEAVTPPVPTSGSASLHLRPAIAAETTMH